MSRSIRLSIDRSAFVTCGRCSAAPTGEALWPTPPGHDHADGATDGDPVFPTETVGAIGMGIEFRQGTESLVAWTGFLPDEATFDVELEVGRSNQEIPFPYVLDGARDIALADVGALVDAVPPSLTPKPDTVALLRRLHGAGVTLHECLKAADELAAMGVPVRVIDPFTIKPLDRDRLAEMLAGYAAPVAA